ncbi:FecR domain-containing protein [Uliginosibacterium paludis]|uniref:FecR domain-containing protein n=1 Tax=Uliginosibacterium paludis TaxID=1615952 RepID=A0ABV2CUG4_9RHOO
MRESFPQTIEEEAADWLVRMAEGPLAPTEQLAWQQWHERSALHAEAWARAERVLQKLHRIPGAIALPGLEAAARSRRAALSRIGKLVLGVAVMPLAWQAWRSDLRRSLQADQRTASGEQRSLPLEEGTQLLLNTATALDTDLRPSGYELRLHAGEVWVDAARASRAIRLETPHGVLETQRARFAVRVWPGHSQLVVAEGLLDLRAEPGTHVGAGEGLRFGSGLAARAPADLAVALAWTRGLLFADQMRLDTLAAELARYRPGLIECDERIAALRVSGTFPVGSVAATERAFGMLMDTHPVEITQRAAGLWVSWHASATA